MEIVGLTLVPKNSFFSQLRSRFVSKSWLSLNFLSQLYELAFLEKRLSLLNKKSTFVLVSGIFAIEFMPKYYLKGQQNTVYA